MRSKRKVLKPKWMNDYIFKLDLRQNFYLRDRRIIQKRVNSNQSEEKEWACALEALIQDFMIPNRCKTVKKTMVGVCTYLKYQKLLLNKGRISKKTKTIPRKGTINEKGEFTQEKAKYYNIFIHKFFKGNFQRLTHVYITQR